MTDCIFCQIIQGKLPAEKILEQDDYLVIKDIAPKAPYHFLILPKRHYESIEVARQEDSELLGRMLLAAKELSKRSGVSRKGYRLVINTGPDGGQLVPHLHFHFLGGGKIKGLA